MALGARRLSIIDLAGGRQPIANEDGSVWVAFNGELFEYPELRQELLARGHRLATRCDTEAWVHLYEDLGEGMFAKARGQFAVSLWDRNSRTLILGRDRVGICPLYYAEADGWLLWGSEIKALLASGMVAGQARRPGHRSPLHLLLRGHDPDVLRGGHARCRPATSSRSGTGGSPSISTGTSTSPTPAPSAGWTIPTPLVEELEVAAPAGGRAAAAERRAGRHLHQRRARLDGRPRPLQPAPGRADPGVHDRLRGGRARRARPLDRGRRGAGLAADHRDDGQGDDRLAPFPSWSAPPRGRCSTPRARRSCGWPRPCIGQGYKVALTGEGADEALAGYVWYKTQKIRDGVYRHGGPTGPAALAQPGRSARVAGRRMVIPAEQAIGGVRPAQQDMYEMISQSKPVLYSEAMWQRLGDHNPYCRPGHHQRPDRPLAPAEPVALRRLQGDAGRPADDLQGRPDRHERVGRDALSLSSTTT